MSKAIAAKQTDQETNSLIFNLSVLFSESPAWDWVGLNPGLANLVSLRTVCI
jgi:hypothetical protein